MEMTFGSSRIYCHLKSMAYQPNAWQGMRDVTSNVVLMIHIDLITDNWSKRASEQMNESRLEKKKSWTKDENGKCVKDDCDWFRGKKPKKERMNCMFKLWLLCVVCVLIMDTLLLRKFDSKFIFSSIFYLFSCNHLVNGLSSKTIPTVRYEKSILEFLFLLPSLDN